METYRVNFFNAGGKFHLKPESWDGIVNICGAICGNHSIDDKMFVDSDRVLINQHFGYPANPDYFCKRCLVHALVDITKTKAVFLGKFGVNQTEKKSVFPK